MAQPSPPQQSKHALQSDSSPAANPAQFVPRKEFRRDQRVISSFSLLALSGANLVRLYSFPPAVISALRRLFDHQNLITSVREHAHKNFFEFTLDRRPWASPKSIDSEKLIVAILGAILQCGYSFLSTIDYAREPDDRLAIAFSRPIAVPPTSAPAASSSAITLPQPTRTPFAISFVSPSLLRVVDPPLHSTPAILTAVRGSWPRGVVSEKKLGESTYQFKLKGYKFFQEDTFAFDSLQQILSLLTTLDTHAFTLLTSLTLTNRSRKQDLWIFTGPTDDAPPLDSQQSSPDTSTLELRGENSPYGTQNSNEKLSPISSVHRLGNTAPTTSSPLKQSSPPTLRAQGNILRKTSPKVQIPLAYQSDADSAANSPVENKQHPFSSSMGSVDMTGVGSGRGKGGERLSMSPDVLYMTAGIKGPQWLVPGQTIPLSHTRSSSTPAIILNGTPLQRSTSHDSRPGMSHSGSGSSERRVAQTEPARPTTPPITYTAISSQPPQLPPIHSPSPVSANGHDYFLSRDHTQTHGYEGFRRGKDGLREREAAPDTPRTPTPPLLTPGTFRDSAYSSTTGHTSYEIPIAWTGRDPDPSRATLAGIQEEDEYARSNEPEQQEQSRPSQNRISTGPLLPGAWAAPPREERRYDDVASTLPPTIRKQPSQEQDNHSRSGQISYNSQETITMDRDRGRRDHHVVSPKSDEKMDSGSSAAPNGTARRRRSPTRKETESSGWVLVNIDRGDRASAENKGKGRQVQSVSPDPARRARSPTQNTNTSGSTAPPRSIQHTRSSSDSRLPRTQQPTHKGGTAMSSMSPAAKAIVIIDAVGAKEKEQEKASGSGLKRIFAKGKDKGHPRVT